jgi:regulator of sigma E protease
MIWSYLSVPVSLLLVLTIVVFIHEMGHFLLARWCGVQVQAFSIGFGREIWGFTDRKGTRWKLSWIPLGGYVRFVDDENAASAPSREAVERMSPSERGGAFQTKPLGHRALIVVAGPAFNIISAVIFLVVTFWLVGVDGREPVIDVVEPGSPAARAGIVAGDRVVQANGQEMRRWVEVQRLISRNASDSPIELVLNRDGRPLHTTVAPEKRKAQDLLGGTVELGEIGIGKSVPAVIGRVLPNGAAERAGLQPGDTVLLVDGAPVRHFGDLQRMVRANDGAPMQLIVEREGRRFEFSIVPAPVPQSTPAGAETGQRPVRLIGISPRPEAERRYDFLSSLRFSTQEVLYYTEEMLRAIPRIPAAVAKVFSFQKQNELGGPIAIGQMSAHAVESGLGGFLNWIAVFSVMLGIMNLLPIPLLDGGHLMFYALEAVRGKPLDERKQEISFKIGMAVLGTMMFAAVFGDIIRKLGLG